MLPQRCGGMGVMCMTDEENFAKYHPDVNEMTILEAAQAFGIGDEVISLSGRRTGIDSFVLVLARGNHQHTLVLMTGVCARELGALLVSEGFGPQ